MSNAPSFAFQFLAPNESAIQAEPELGGDEKPLAGLRRRIIERARENAAERMDSLMVSLQRDAISLAPTGLIDEGALKVINLPQFEPIEGRDSESFAALQEWEGLVTGVKQGVVFADLFNVTGNEAVVSETAEIPLDEIADADKERAVPGAIFRWAVGYVRKASGQKMRGSLIYFRRGSFTRNRVEEQVPALRFEEEDE